MQNEPPYILEWINKITCTKCKKKGHLAFNYPPEYNNKVRKMMTKTNRDNSHNLEQKSCENETIE